VELIHQLNFEEMRKYSRAMKIQLNSPIHNLSLTTNHEEAPQIDLRSMLDQTILSLRQNQTVQKCLTSNKCQDEAARSLNLDLPQVVDILRIHYVEVIHRHTGEWNLHIQAELPSNLDLLQVSNNEQREDDPA
jgi:hypothetical protein